MIEKEKKSFIENLREHFSKTSMLCNHHSIKNTMYGKKCFCSLSGERCNKIGCPRLRKGEYYKPKKRGKWYQEEEYQNEES